MSERPILFSAPMVRAILEGRKTQTRRVVKSPRMTAIADGKPCGPILFDLERAHSDSLKQCGYLHVPFAHPQDGWEKNPKHDTRMRVYCPHGSPGDRLWVKETYRVGMECDDTKPSDVESMPFSEDDPFTGVVHFEADGAPTEGFGKLRPGLFMCRWMSRITLEIVSVRVERLQEISEADAIAEGVQTHAQKYGLPEMKLHGTTPWYRYDGEACAAVSAKESYRTLWESINGPGSWSANPRVWVIEFRRIER